MAKLLNLDDLFEDDGRILVLADLNDGGNAGTLVRAADAFGVSKLLFGSNGAEPYHPKVVRAATGSLFRMRIATADASEFAEIKRARRWTCLGLSREGEPISAAPAARTALIVGHERHGLGRWQIACDRLLAIPMPGAAESLNAAIAGAIALYELSRPRN
ncbi:MAG: RNA methyltransferase [Candidatus Eremiobacteraeota bacterium]|nr:RNA methyltransferase [Candidatus Eremiobacteraeota bacterium]